MDRPRLSHGRMPLMKKLAWLPLVLAFLLPACGSDGGPGVGPGSLLVGAACDADRHCDSRCVKGKNYPGGMCTVSCRDDRDCPSGTACIDDHGGICALACTVHRDCDFMGGRYLCDAKSRKGSAGRALVCRVP